LLEKGYEVHGIIRRASTFNTSRIDHLYADPHINRRADVPALRRPGRFREPGKLLYELKPRKFIISARKAMCG